MAQRKRQTLKGYFEVGDIPTQQNYHDWIESNVLLSDVNSGSILLTGSISLNGTNGYITASQNISASGTVYAARFEPNIITSGIISSSAITGTSSFGTEIVLDYNTQLQSKDGGTNVLNLAYLANTNNFIFADNTYPTKVLGTSITLDSITDIMLDSGTGGITASKNGTETVWIDTTYGHITASGDISASGTIYANDFKSSGGDISGVNFHDNLNITGSITASGDISSSGLISAANFHVPGQGRISFDNTDTDDQFIKGLDNSIVVDGDDTVRLKADLYVEFVDDSNNATVSVDGNNGHVTASIISASSTFVGAPIHIVTHAWFSNTTSKFPSGDLSHLMNGNSNFGWADRAWNDSVTKTEVFDNNQLNGVNDHNKGVPIQHNVTDIQLTGYMRASDASDVTEMNYWLFKGNRSDGTGPSVTFLASASAGTVGTNYNEIYITGSTGLQADAGDLIFVFANTDVGGTGTGRNVRGMYTVTAKTRE